MTYATPADLEPVAAAYGVALPTADKLTALCDLATRDVQRHLGASWDPVALFAEQVEALRDATAIQAVFRAAQGGDAALGLDDGLASVGPLSFSLRSAPRLSPEAVERLVGFGLYARSATVTPDAAP